MKLSWTRAARVRLAWTRGGGVRFVTLLCVGLLTLSFSALAQEATIVGTVVDPSGSVVPNATVVATDTNTNQAQTTKTNDVGQYAFPALPIGNYNIEAKAPGFKTSTQTGIVLNVAARTRVDFKLQLGATEQSVTVEANAVRVQSDTGAQSTVITGQQLTQLATNGRSLLSLYDLTPGASSLQGMFQVPTSVSGNINVSFNGTRPVDNLELIDGAENMDRGGSQPSVMPSIDAIAEFRTMTSNYSPEYGLTTGATLTSVIKSGTKTFHAEGWEFNRNDAFDARNYFNPAPNPVAELRFNTYGFNVGGEVPFMKRHPTFFFYNMEWRKLIQGGVYNVVVPLPTTYTGDFSNTAQLAALGLNVPHTPCAAQLSSSEQAAFASAGQTLSTCDANGNVTTAVPFTNNMIPTSLLSANAQTLLNAGIFPGPTNGGDRFQGTPPVPTNVREEIVRIDHTFNDKLSMFGHFVADQVAQTFGTTMWSSDNVPTIGNTFGNPSYSAVVHASYMISPTLLNETAFNYNGNRIHILPQGVYAAPSGFTFNRIYTGPNLDNRIPSIDLNGATGTDYTSNWTPWNNAANDYQIRDDISWTKGAHQLKFGASWALYTKLQDLFNTTQGNFNFNGVYTGNDFADFLLGYAQGYNEAGVQDSGQWNNISYAAYILDNWRVNNRLTLNLGLRWDGIPHTYEANDRMANFYPNMYNPDMAPIFVTGSNTEISPTSPGLGTSPNPILNGYLFYLNGIGIEGQPGVPKGLVNNHWLNFGPRVGFAYDLTGQGKTVLRGGFGQMFERIQGNDMYDAGGTPPFSGAFNANDVLLSDPHTLVSGGTVSSPILVNGNITGLDQYNYKNPTVYQYSFGMQQALGNDAILSLSYVGSQSRYQSFRQNINLPPLTDLPSLIGNTTNLINQEVPYLGYQGIDMSTNLANGHYNSLQAEIRGNLTHDLMLQFGYTLSKSIDSSFSNGDGFDLQNISNPYQGWQYDNGPSVFDRRNVAFVNFVYSIPAFENTSNMLLKSVAGGWQLSGIVTMESGPPINVTLAGSETSVCNVLPDCTNRPDLVGSISYPQSVNAWFSPASFANPTPGTWGDLGKDALRGPGRDNWNLSLFKNFVLSAERGSRIELRLETFNTWNHTQWLGGDAVNGGISNQLGASDFGAITGAYDPRVLQLGAKVYF
jgi:Carboxypeptidase regulatory-like domain